MKMLETIARALYAQEEGCEPSDAFWQANADNSIIKDYLNMARAVLTALETPTPEMVEAGGDALLNQIEGSEAVEAEVCWQAMIRAAKEAQ